MVAWIYCKNWPTSWAPRFFIVFKLATCNICAANSKTLCLKNILNAFQNSKSIRELLVWTSRNGFKHSSWTCRQIFPNNQRNFSWGDIPVGRRPNQKCIDFRNEFCPGGSTSYCMKSKESWREEIYRKKRDKWKRAKNKSDFHGPFRLLTGGPVNANSPDSISIDKLVLKNTAVLWLVPLTRCKLFARGNLQVSIGNTAVLIDNLEKTMLNSATKHYLCLWICHIWKALPNIPARVGTSMPSIELSANICDFSDHAFRITIITNG